MSAIKFLQMTTTCEVMAIVATGMWILLFDRAGMTAYGQMSGTLIPFIAPQIAAAFGGPQLKKFMEDRQAMSNIKQNGK